MRFNNFSFPKEYQNIIEKIFELCERAENDGFGGLRKSGFESLESNYFSFVFLCGGNREHYNSREVLTPIIKQNNHAIIMISEDWEKFVGDLDLLTFEIVLEALSKMIVIPVESAGTICELGAFTRVNEEYNKVVAIVDKEHMESPNSFIIKGPISFLSKIDNYRVITAEFLKENNFTKLIENEHIFNLNKHPLLLNKIKFKTYFKQHEKENKYYISNLQTFFAAILDVVCLFNVVSVDLIMEFFSKRFNDRNFRINTPILETNNSNVRKIVSTLLQIFTSSGLLYNKGELFFVNNINILNSVENNDRWIGKILFTKAFINTDEYLKIKALTAELTRKAKKYESI